MLSIFHVFVSHLYVFFGEMHVLSLFYFISVLFLAYRSFFSLGRFIPRYFNLFAAMVNGIVSLISLIFSLLVCKNARDFCMLILYPATLL